MNKLLALAALAGTTALAAATTVPHTRPTAPADNVSLLQRYDLAPLLLTAASTGEATEPMNGFFGTDRYRIELVTTKVQRDPKQPGHYQVWGKDRFKGRVTPFAGVITLTNARQLAAKSDNWPTLYVASGSYELREAASQRGAGTFTGHITLEFSLKDGKPELSYYYQDGPTKGGTILYDGTCTSATGQTKPAVWVANIWTYGGSQVADDFIIGGRNQHFNAKYAKLGWNNYWQNDEWWTSSPQASARVK